MKSYLHISNHIKEKRKKLIKIKEVSDKEILDLFSCTIETPVEVSETEGIDKFNKLLKLLCSFIK